MKYTDEQLLVEAAKRYPIGTIYHRVSNDGSKINPDSDNNHLCTVPANVVFKISPTKDINHESIVWVLDTKDGAFGWIYANRMWADIIKYPNNHVNNKIIEYEIY